MGEYVFVVTTPRSTLRVVGQIGLFENDLYYIEISVNI